MRPAFAHGVDAGFHDICGSVEVGLADFQMNDAFALALEGAGFVQNFESSLGAQARHATGELQFVLNGSWHRANSCAANPKLYAARLAVNEAGRGVDSRGLQRGLDELIS